LSYWVDHILADNQNRPFTLDCFAAKQVYILSSCHQGQIIHEAGEAEALGAQTPRYYENLQSRTALGPKFLERKYANTCTRGPQSLSCLRARRDHDPTLAAIPENAVEGAKQYR